MTNETSGPVGPSGWYPDPGDPSQLRWWDGSAWSEHTYAAAEAPVWSEGAESPPPASEPSAQDRRAAQAQATQPSLPLPPLPPPPAEPPAGGRRRSRWWLVGGAAVVVLLIGVGVAVVLSRGDAYPSTWDPRVTDLVAFDQKARGLDFKHPVEVVLVPEDEFAASVRVDETQLDEEDLQNVTTAEAQLRAFGLIDGSVDLVDTTSDIQSAGTLAYYSPKDEKIYVRGTEITPAVKATLAHELVHVLQDQHFGLEEMLKDSPDPGAVRSIVEGDASRIRQAYLDQLPESEQTAIEDERQSGFDDSGLAKMPDALVAANSAPYLLGEPAVGVLVARGGNSEVNQAFLKPPTADVQILDPRRLSEDAPEPVTLPDLPEGATAQGPEDTNGALFWDIVLARRIGLHPALAFADSWDGDSSVTYELDGRTCTVSVIRATDAAAAASMTASLQAWLAAGPPTTDEQTYARAGSAENTVVLGVCDPGSDSVAAGVENSQEAISLASLRLELERQALEARLTMTAARCIADRGVAVVDTEDLGASADPDQVRAKLITAIGTATVACGAKPS